MIAEKTAEPFSGIYIAPEAALYLTATLTRDVPSYTLKHPISSRRVIHWIRVGLTTPSLAGIGGRELLLSFEDLVSMRVIALLRAFGVSWPKIHKAEQWLREQTGYPRPFAIKRVWTETRDVFAEFPAGFITASRHGQIAFVELFEEYLQSVEDMSFIPHDGVNVAETWTPHDDVLMNPKIQFGDPCIKGTRLPTQILWRMYNGGDNIPYLSRAFLISEQQINNALEWENRLRTIQQTKVSSRQ